MTKKIGLSLGADLCWPRCYEDLVEALDLSLAMDGDTISFDVERVSIEPYDLRQACSYALVIDRLTHWYHTSREWIKKAILLDDLYVLNNPWSLQSMEKQTSYCAMMRLGMPVPETWMVPPKAYEPTPDLRSTLHRYAKLFDVGQVGDALGYPVIMKPYDGGGWRAVTKANDEAALRRAYEASGTLVMHVQKAVDPYDAFVRCIGVGPRVRFVKYDVDAPLHDRYTCEHGFLTDAEAAQLRATTLTINTFFGWEFNSCEVMRREGVWHPIDFANACPDSQVTSLHYHFPWLVKSLLEWSLYCAATGRPMRRHVDWSDYYAIADTDASYEDKLAAYGKVAESRLETDRFEAFCETHLAQLDEVVWTYFGSERAKAAVRQKVDAMYPEHEVEAFTELFWARIQDWRAEAQP
ncbi:MAG: RimK family alpha-L-glutamate ligase [Sandaracinaceae bacterium]